MIEAASLRPPGHNLAAYPQHCCTQRSTHWWMDVGSVIANPGAAGAQMASQHQLAQAAAANVAAHTTQHASAKHESVGEFITHVFETSVDSTAQVIVGASVLLGALPTPHLASGLTYGAVALLAHNKPNQSAIASHAGLTVEGLMAAKEAAHVEAGVSKWGTVLGNESGFLAGVSRFLGKALPTMTIVTGLSQAGKTLYRERDPMALLRTDKGREGVLNAVGGTMLLLPFPPTKILGAVIMGAAIVNDLGGMKKLDDPRYESKETTSPATTHGPVGDALHAASGFARGFLGLAPAPSGTASSSPGATTGVG